MKDIIIKLDIKMVAPAYEIVVTLTHDVAHRLGHAAGGAVVEALRYRPEGHGFDSR
jgi:hypothetical protein